MKGYVPRLALKKRYKTTRKWPIQKQLLLNYTTFGPDTFFLKRKKREKRLIMQTIFHFRGNPTPRRTWWSFGKMENAGIKFGHGANQHTRGSSTRIYTQQVLGVISPTTFKEKFRAGWL